MSVLVGVDTGGTFTDIVWFEAGELRVHKVLSTPEDPSKAILEGLKALGTSDELDALVHGSTVATNAVLEHRGARTGLITTAGFRDVLEIGRQTRPKLYDLRQEKEPPLVPRERRVEVVERLNERGEVMTELDEESLEKAIQALQDEEVESVAICLLFSFTNPKHEQEVAKAAKSLGVPISVSSEVVPEFREFERTSTVVLNAYVAPVMGRYLEKLETSLPDNLPFRVMQSNGGSISSQTARQNAARTLLSGPAAGVVGAAFVAGASGFDKVISFDTGGTSSDVALIDGELSETTEGKVGGYPCKLPMIDIHTVGAGGGSVAWFDAGGALRVGPKSAGAEPGPAAYGNGGEEATLTDANVVLGRLLPDNFLGGEMTLQKDAAKKAVAKVAKRLGTSSENAALGIVRVANANMEAAVRVITVERGVDQRECTLVAFGGAGPLQACELASALSIPRVLIPNTAGVLSALGMLAADVKKDYVQTIMLSADEAQGEVEETFAGLYEQGKGELKHEGFGEEEMGLEPFLDLRYQGQSFELVVPYEGSVGDAVRAFHNAHEQRFGHSNEEERVQVVNARLKAKASAEKPELPSEEVSEYDAEPSSVQEVVFEREGEVERLEAGIFERDTLKPGAHFEGPAIVTQYDTTTVIPPGWRAEVDAVKNLIIEVVVSA